MTTATPLGDARNRLSELVDRAASTHERFAITVHGHARAVLLSADDLASLEETLEILSDSDAMQALAEAERDIAAGNLFTLEDAQAALRARRTGK